MPFMSDAVICFDLDDTLYKEIDFVKSAFGEIAENAGYPEGVQQMMEWYYEGKNVFAELIAAYRLDMTVANCINIYKNHLPKISLEIEVKGLLDYLKKHGSVLGIITDGRSISQRNKLSALGLNGFFDIEVISEEFGSEKPNLRNYQIVMEKFTEGKCFWYVGDNPQKDFIAPNKLGWNTVCLLDDGRNIHKQHFNLEADYLPMNCIQNIEELYHFLS